MGCGRFGASKGSTVMPVSGPEGVRPTPKGAVALDRIKTAGWIAPRIRDSLTMRIVKAENARLPHTERQS